MIKSDNQAAATKQDLLDVLGTVMGAITTLEIRINNVEDKIDGMATKDDLENLKHQLLLSDEQTRRDIADMYQDTLSSHDDRLTKLEVVTGLKAA